MCRRSGSAHSSLFGEEPALDVVFADRTGHKSTPVFILTEEQSRRVGQNSCLRMQLSGREIDMKRANYLLIVYNNGLKKPIQLWVSAKAHFLATSQSNPPEKRFAVPTAAARDISAPAQQA